MPRNAEAPAPFDYSRNLRDGRADIQAPCQLFLDTLFAGCTVLDFGGGLGQSKARIRHNRVTTYDVDARLRPFLDVAGGEPPAGPFDIVTSFDVVEHVEDDVGYLRAAAARARRAVFVTTPNWHVSKCQSSHHVREYTGAELRDLAAAVWPTEALRLFAHFKDGIGSWFDPVPPEAWDLHMGSKHALLVLLDPADRARIDGFFAGRWGTALQPAARWVPRLAEDDAIAEPITFTREGA